MEIPIEHGTKYVKGSIVAYFTRNLRELKECCGRDMRDDVYLESFHTRLMMERFGLLSQEVIDLFNEMTVYHLGRSMNEFTELSNILARNGAAEAHGLPLPLRPLTEKEREDITRYQSFLYGRVAKSEPIEY